MGSFNQISKNHWLLSGVLSYATVNDFLAKGQKIILQTSQHESLLFDLNQINDADSAGVSILIEWLRFAQKKGSTLAYSNIPERMLSLMQVNGVDSILVQ